MPFGLTNAPDTFQSLMNQVFRPFLHRVLVFFNDILVYSSNEDTHAKHLRMVLNVLRDNQLFTNKKKCLFRQKRIQYLGHWVSAQGVELDGEKVQSDG